MGTKVQLDTYLPGYCSMRDLNHDSDGTSWNIIYGENKLPNGQYYYSHLPRPVADLLPEAEKDVLKKTILKHEAVFKNQVLELHRLYRVQKDLMDEIQRNEQYKHRIPYEASSSSSFLPSQMTSDDAHRRHSSSFPFTNLICEGPPVSVPETIQSSAGTSLKGKSTQTCSVPLQRCGSPKGSEVSESRPTKLRKMIDLHLLADEYIDSDEVEQQGNGAAFDSGEKLFPSHCGKTAYQKDVSRSDSCLRTPNVLADLNEPAQSEETSAHPSLNILAAPNPDFLRNSKHGDMNGKLNNFEYDGKGNGHHWFSSVLKGGHKDNWRSVHQTNHPERASVSSSLSKNSHQQSGFFPPHPVKEDTWPATINDGFKTFDRSQSFSSSNREAAYQLPSHVPSDFVKSWDHSWGKPNGYLSQKSLSVQRSPYHNSASLSKSAQSSLHSDEFGCNGWHLSKHPKCDPGSVAESSVQSGFYQGSSSGFKNLPAHFCNAASSYVNGSYTGSSNFLKGTNSLDLNSTRDLNLNMLPLSKEGVEIIDSEVKREDPLSVLPWLRSRNEAGSARSGLNKAESGLSHGPHELFERGEAGNMLDHQNSVASTSGDTRNMVHATESGRKGLFDINLPCDPEDFDDVAAPSEIVVREDKTESRHSSDLQNMIDLNSSVIEDEIPSRSIATNNSTTANSMKSAGKAIIDLEAPIDLGSEEDNCVSGDRLLTNQHQLLQAPPQNSSGSADEELAMVVAEAIVAMSSCASENPSGDAIRPHLVEEASGSEDALSWFADIVCSGADDNKDCLSSEADPFEEMTLKLTECTVEEYFPSPPVIDIPAVEEPSPAAVTGRTRRLPARRGRQRRDFQRDILPGLTSLARHEVTEDLQTFGGLMRATGHAWHCGSRRSGSGRGRRRSVVAAPPPVTPQIVTTATEKQPIKNGEIILEDRSLTSWGKTTRRPRRQRCPSAAGNLAPIALT